MREGKKGFSSSTMTGKRTEHHTVNIETPQVPRGRTQDLAAW